MSKRRLSIQPRASSIGIRGSEGTKETKTRIVLITEGEVTEPDYFLSSIHDLIDEEKYHIDIVKKHSGDYEKLRDFAQDAEKQSSKSGITEYWIVADTEDYRKAIEDFQVLTDWAKKSDYRNLALSNIMFEVWVLMHDGNRQALDTKSAIHEAMRQIQSKKGKTGPLAHYSDSNKHLNRIRFGEEEVRCAIRLAKNKRSTFDTGSEKQPPMQSGTTTVDLLAEKPEYASSIRDDKL